MSASVDPFDKNPLLSPSIWVFGPTDWRAFVVSLYDETKGKKGKKTKKIPVPAACSRNKKGSIIFKIRRDPKYVTTAEIKQFSAQLELATDEIEKLLTKRKIVIEKDTENANSELPRNSDK
jgi:hypothetical protein